jgi:FKBP12-rapamycin complex-associated protein
MPSSPPPPRPTLHPSPSPAGTPLGGGVIGGGGTTGEDYGTDLLPSAGLVTSSEDYYPTVAINALMRVLRDSALASQHQVRGSGHQ